jgi:hypothetical protein
MTLDGRARKGVNVTGFSGCRRVADSGSARLRRAPAERKVWANESWMREAGEKLPLMRSLVCLVPGLRPHIEADLSSSCTLLSYISDDVWPSHRSTELTGTPSRHCVLHHNPSLYLICARGTPDLAATIDKLVCRGMLLGWQVVDAEAFSGYHLLSNESVM